jgi:hypothetical protein
LNGVEGERVHRNGAQIVIPSPNIAGDLAESIILGKRGAEKGKESKEIGLKTTLDVTQTASAHL